MLDEEHRGPELLYEALELHTGVDVDVVERLVPDVEMGALAQARGEEDLFLLPGGKPAISALSSARGKSSLRSTVMKRLSGRSRPAAKLSGVPARREASCGTADIMSPEPRSTAPACSTHSPVSSFMRLLLPLPFPPQRATRSPRFISKLAGLPEGRPE